jgi:hypothetical protein
MNLHRVGRLASTLVASQLRSGRSSSDPTSFTGRPLLIALVDVGLFVGAAALVAEGVRAVALTRSEVLALLGALLPFVPLIAVGVVLVAGLMFELTTTSKFASSDAANWLPISPAEYLSASVAAIAYTYSPAVAATLGGLLPLAVLAGSVPVYLAAVALTAVALLEGAVLVEMVRAVTQRVSSVAAGRRGRMSLVVRAALLIFVILLLQLAFNPVFLFAVAQRLTTVALITAAIPFFWSTAALTQWTMGNAEVGTGFAVAQVAFVLLLGYLAIDLRERAWVPSPVEVQLEAHRYAARNPVLALVGLTEAESALVVKDLKGLVRRREMLPNLVVPIVLVILVLVEGGALGGLVSVLWIGWVAGFFSLLIAGTSIGQERRAVQSLYAFPLSAASFVRAKATFVLVPSLIVAVALSLIVGLYFGLSPGVVLAVLAFVVAASVVLTFWGLAFASRFSDFQERPRPQFMRPGGMLAATGSGMAVLFAILVPATIAILSPSPWSLPVGLLGAAIAVVAGTLAVLWTRSGFRKLFRTLPF